MRVDNVCEVCNQFDETKNHIFFRCEISHIFWFCFPLQINSFELEGADFLATWVTFCNKVKGKVNELDLLQEFMFGLWRLWKNRNEMVFKGEHRQPLEILELWKTNLTEFRDTGVLRAADIKPSDAKIVSNPVRMSAHWQKLGFRSIKRLCGLV